MSLSPGEDVALDLLWALATGQQWDKLGLERYADLVRLRFRLPQAINHVLAHKTTPAVKQWQKGVRTFLKKLGFYAGKYAHRDDTRLRPLLQQYLVDVTAPASGKVAHVHVYTDPAQELQHRRFSSRTLKKCAKADPYIAALCAYTREAKIRANQEVGGIAIGVMHGSEGLSRFWPKLRKQARGRRIQSVSFYGHGSPDSQQVGQDVLDYKSAIPADIAAYMGTNVRIRLYGCRLMPAGPGAAGARERFSALGSHIANRMLPRGGSVVGSTKDVNVDLDRWRIIAPKKRDLLTHMFRAWDGAKVMSDILRFFSEMVAAGVKVKKQAAVPAKTPTQAAATAAPLDYPDAYPDQYPDAGYYPN